MLLTLPERHTKLLNLGSVSTGLMNRVYPFPLPAPRLEAHLYWHESVENDPANRWLREEITGAGANSPEKTNGSFCGPRAVRICYALARISGV